MSHSLITAAGAVRWIGNRVQLLFQPVSLALENHDAAENEEPRSFIARRSGLVEIRQIHAR